MPGDDPPEFASQERSRAQRIADRVLALGEADLEAEWARVHRFRGRLLRISGF